MKKKYLIMLSSFTLVALLAACSEKEEIAPEKEVGKEEVVSEVTAPPKPTPMEGSTDKKSEPVTDKVKEDVKEESTQPVTETPKEEPKQEPAKSVVIDSGEAAIELLKTNLEDGQNEDHVFGASAETERDEKGTFYTVRLSSLSLRLAGGTGTIENYKVYEDGTFDVFR